MTDRTSRIPGFYKKRGMYIGDAPRIVTGRAEIKIIAPRDQRDEIVGAIGKANIISVEENLSELGLVLNKKAIKTKGVVARITNEIAMNNINLAELIICPPELFFYLNEQDMVRAHESILQLIRQ